MRLNSVCCDRDERNTSYTRTRIALTRAETCNMHDIPSKCSSDACTEVVPLQLPPNPPEAQLDGAPKHWDLLISSPFTLPTGR